MMFTVGAHFSSQFTFLQVLIPQTKEMEAGNKESHKEDDAGASFQGTCAFSEL